MTRTLLLAAALVTITGAASANGVKIDWEHQTPIAGDGAPMVSKFCEQNPSLAICRGFFDTVPPIFRKPGRISNGFIIAPRQPMAPRMMPTPHRPR